MILIENKKIIDHAFKMADLCVFELCRLTVIREYDILRWIPFDESKSLLVVLPIAVDLSFESYFTHRYYSYLPDL